MAATSGNSTLIQGIPSIRSVNLEDLPALGTREKKVSTRESRLDNFRVNWDTAVRLRVSLRLRSRLRSRIGRGSPSGSGPVSPSLPTVTQSTPTQPLKSPSTFLPLSLPLILR